jgi:hypothetical protein
MSDADAAAAVLTTEPKWLIASYTTTIVAVVAFALFALIYTRVFGKGKNATTEEFITARHSQGKWRIAWSFFAGAVGAWVIVSPASYAGYAGILGLTFYSLASGLPIIVAGACRRAGGGKAGAPAPACLLRGGGGDDKRAPMRPSPAPHLPPPRPAQACSARRSRRRCRTAAPSPTSSATASARC